MTQKRSPTGSHLLMLLQELLPGNYKPTPTHFFLTLLHKKGLLQRCFTQNIDSLEVAAGLPKDMVIAAHGNFDTASCVDCRKPAKLDQVLSCLSQEQVYLLQYNILSDDPLQCTMASYTHVSCRFRLANIAQVLSSQVCAVHHVFV